MKMNLEMSEVEVEGAVDAIFMPDSQAWVHKVLFPPNRKDIAIALRAEKYRPLEGKYYINIHFLVWKTAGGEIKTHRLPEAYRGRTYNVDEIIKTDGEWMELKTSLGKNFVNLKEVGCES